MGSGLLLLKPLSLSLLAGSLPRRVTVLVSTSIVKGTSSRIGSASRAEMGGLDAWAEHHKKK
jgi:hypothetical protein